MHFRCSGKLVNAKYRTFIALTWCRLRSCAHIISSVSRVLIYRDTRCCGQCWLHLSGLQKEGAPSVLHCPPHDVIGKGREAMVIMAVEGQLMAFWSAMYRSIQGQTGTTRQPMPKRFLYLHCTLYHLKIGGKKVVMNGCVGSCACWCLMIQLYEHPTALLQLNSGEQIMILLLASSSQPAVILTTHWRATWKNWPGPTPR